MAFPTTLALITALWSGPARTKSIALWSALGGGDLRARPARRGRAARALLVGLGVPDHAAAGRRRAGDGGRVRAEPRQRDDRSGRQPRRDPVGRAGRRRSSWRSTSRRFRTRARWRSGWRPSRSPPVIAFVIRQRRRAEPALRPRRRGATRSSGWRRAPGIIVFGTLMGAMFIGQQFLQNVLGYSTLEAGRAILPAVVLHGAGRASVGQARRGARGTVHAAHRLRLLPARLPHDAAAVERGHLVLVGRPRLRARRRPASASPGTPASHSLTGSVPVRRAGMASGTADLQRDLGGAIMQSILGALLTAGYAAAVTAAIATAPNARARSRTASQSQLTKSFAERRADRRAVPAVRNADHGGARSSRSSTGPTGPTRPGSSPS